MTQRRRANPYGKWGKHIELFEMFESWSEDDEAQAAVAEQEGWDVQEGTGAPEGRADFPLFLLTTTRHKLREAFKRRAAQWDRYVGIERAEDFRIHTASQLNGISGMGEVPEFDEYPRLRSSEEGAPPFSVGKHGGVYEVTYEMVVNDETNKILDRTPTELGRMAAAYVSRTIIALIESNPNWIDGDPFFTANPRGGLPNGNEYTGSDAEPTEDNLVTIVSDLDDTEDSEGFPIDISPGVVLTKQKRTQLIFKRIIRSQETGATANDTAGGVFDKGTYNAAEGLLPEGSILTESYLRDPNDWILLAETGRPAFIVAFLRDQREPGIWIQDSGMRSIGSGAKDPYSMDFDGLPMKIRQVFGVALGDPRSARRARRA